MFLCLPFFSLIRGPRRFTTGSVDCGKMVSPNDCDMFRAASPELAEKTKEYWQRLMEPAARIKLPSELLTNVIRASQVHIPG